MRKSLEKWEDFVSSVLMFGPLRGALRCLSRCAPEGSPSASRLLNRLAGNDSTFAWIIHRMAAAGLQGKTPEKVYAESTNACNGQCVMCNRQRMTRKAGIMDFGLFEDIANQYAALGAHEMRFHNFGEPMIDRRLPEKVAYAKRQGIRSTVMYSNGSLLTENTARALIEGGLDRLYISFDGGTKETYERIRVGLSFDAVSENIIRMMKIREEMGSNSPQVELVLLPIDNDADEVRRFQERWNGVVDGVRISALHDFAGQGTSCQVAANAARGARQRKIPCYMLWRSMFILWNGDVALCCMDFDGGTILGNARKQPLVEIWQGQGFRRLRRLHLKGDLTSLPLCLKCHVNTYSDHEAKLEALKLWL